MAWEARYVEETVPTLQSARTGSMYRLLTQKSKDQLHGPVERIGEKVVEWLVNSRHLVSDNRNN